MSIAVFLFDRATTEYRKVEFFYYVILSVNKSKQRGASITVTQKLLFR